MTWLARNLRETATYWPPPLINAFGDRSYPSPATVSCHWEERAELFIDTAGTQTNSHAVVTVGSEVKIDGRLFFGDSAEDNPDNEPGADTIRQVERVKTVRGDVVVYRALL